MGLDKLISAFLHKTCLRLGESIPVTGVHVTAITAHHVITVSLRSKLSVCRWWRMPALLLFMVLQLHKELYTAAIHFY